MRRNPPAVGSVITYKFTGSSKKRDPKFRQFSKVAPASLGKKQVQHIKSDPEILCRILKHAFGF